MFDRPKHTAGCSANGRRRIYIYIYIYIRESKVQEECIYVGLSALALDNTALFRNVVNKVPSYETSERIPGVVHIWIYKL